MYNFDRVFDRRNTEVIKWDQIEKNFGDKSVLPFGIADMDFEVLPELKEALIKRSEHPTYGYTFASEDYFQSFIDWNKTRNNFDVKKEEMISVPGIVCATAFILYALTEPGDKIMVNTPSYDPFFNVIKEQGREMVNSALVLKNGRYEYDLVDMEAKFKDGVKLLIICSPHNPVGRVWTMEELEDIVALCEKYNVLIFSDEIHSDLVYKPGCKHIPMLNVKGAQERTIMSMAPSKTFNVAGLKSSILISRNEEIRKKVQTALAHFHVGVNLFGFKATEIAYRHGAQWTDELNAYLYENAKLTVEFFENNMPKVKAFIPDGTYLLWLDFSAYGLSQEELMDKLCKEAKVGLNDGSHYGPNGEGDGFARINIGTQREMLLKGLNQIKEAFEA